MVDYPLRCVVDTSLLIDLYIGKIMVDFFKLPFDFVAPDVIVSELHEPNGKQLMELGLQQRELTGDQVLEVTEPSLLKLSETNKTAKSFFLWHVVYFYRFCLKYI